jgi:predicted dehydrogenase
MDHAIGIIGAGTIVEHGHLPAYARHGLPVRAIFDRDRERAVRLAARYPGLEVAESAEALIGDDRVDVVDIAVEPASQVALAEAALRAGRNVLCQKPLAPTLEEARALVERCRDLPGVRAVNQQMRWEPITAEVRARIDSGDLGEPVAASIHTNMSADFPAGHWLAAEPRLMTLYGTIHFLDSARYLFGEPARVTAKLRRDPDQVAAGELWINAWVEWDSGLLLAIFERYSNWAGDLTATMRVEGRAGTVRGRFGIWDDYPHPAAGTVEFKRHDQSDWKPSTRAGATWMPDAFAHPMLELIAAVDSGRAAPTSWDDNLATLALVEAIYESDATGRTIEAAAAEAQHA